MANDIVYLKEDGGWNYSKGCGSEEKGLESREIEREEWTKYIHVSVEME